jgi:hypothetical protein
MMQIASLSQHNTNDLQIILLQTILQSCDLYQTISQTNYFTNYFTVLPQCDFPPKRFVPNNTIRTGEEDEQNPSDDRQEPPGNLESVSTEKGAY